MHRTDIIKALEKKGFQSKKHDVVKNGVTFKGIILNTGSNVCPVIYPYLLIEGADAPEDVADKVIEIYETYKDSPVNVDVLTSKDWIMEHLSIAIQRTSDEDLVKKPTEFDGIEQYLILLHGAESGSFSIKVTPAMLENAGVSESDAWTIAMIHLVNSTQIVSLRHMLSDMFFQTFGDPIEMEQEIYIMTTRHRTKGASAILCREPLKEFALKHNTDRLLMLPSSIHETLIVPYDLGVDIEQFSSMVKEINAAQVLPEEQLSDRAYIINV